MKLRGASGKKLKAIQLQKLDKLTHVSGELSMLQLVPCSVGNSPQLSMIHTSQRREDTELQAMFQKYETVFQEFTGLPPSRGLFDHKIQLKEDVTALNIRPYRYPALQKTVIEEMVQELIEQVLSDLATVRLRLQWCW